mmetsp:Transcript_56/g.171  ORF Transcript_56/g.171 Transcript_56/m.171 type:complete len:229 (-) Transcript_56:2705-3391(-)
MPYIPAASVRGKSRDVLQCEALSRRSRAGLHGKREKKVAHVEDLPYEHIESKHLLRVRRVDRLLLSLHGSAEHKRCGCKATSGQCKARREPRRPCDSMKSCQTEAGGRAQQEQLQDASGYLQGSSWANAHADGTDIGFFVPQDIWHILHEGDDKAKDSEEGCCNATAKRGHLSGNPKGVSNVVVEAHVHNDAANHNDAQRCQEWETFQAERRHRVGRPQDRARNEREL